MDANLSNLSISKLKKIKKENQQKLKKEYGEMKKKQKLIEEIKRIQKTREKINKPQSKQPSKHKIKTFDDYFQECIKNKTIPPDTPHYFRKALERAIREHEQGIEKEKSSLNDFANKYIIKPKNQSINPLDFFRDKSTYLKEFLRNHRNIKIRYNLVCNMQMIDSIDKRKTITTDIQAYFNSNIFINLESTDEKRLLSLAISEMIEKMEEFIMLGSGWYLKSIEHLEMHTIDYKPMKGGEYIPLPDWIMRKKAIVSIRNSDNKCLLWCVLRYLHPREKNDSRLGDLKQYEKDINTQGLVFPLKIKDISKFEELNPNIPGINVFSVNENKKFYPLRMAN